MSRKEGALGKIYESLDEVLEDLKGTADDLVFRRINHVGFAKTVFFICVKGRNDDFVMTGDLAEFLSVSTQRAYYIFKDLCRVGLLKKDCKSSSMAWYWLVKDNESGLPKINKYFDMACKTLGVNKKIVVKKEI